MREQKVGDQHSEMNWWVRFWARIYIEIDEFFAKITKLNFNLMCMIVNTLKYINRNIFERNWR